MVQNGYPETVGGFCGAGGTVREIIELRGASGATYRFRLWAKGGTHPTAGGHYAFVREKPSGFEVVAVASVEDLSVTRSLHEAAAVQQGATHLFTRLNVSWAARESEVQDMKSHYQSGSTSQLAQSGGD